MVKIGYDAIKISINELKNLNVDLESYYFNNKDYYDLCYNYNTEYIVNFEDIVKELISKNNNCQFILNQNDFRKRLTNELKKDNCWLIFNLSVELLESTYIYINGYDNTKTKIDNCKDLVQVFGFKQIAEVILKEVL